MLAYVFWHWPQDGVDPACYEARLAEFQRTLSQARPEGFRHSAVFQIERPPWIASATAIYEEWYLLENSGAIDVLNDAAVSGACAASHDAAARLAAGGAAGLYKLRQGAPELKGARVAYWFAKPPGTSYAELLSTFDPLARSARRVLWGRQMVLGPAPEFCLHAHTKLALPIAAPAVEISLTRMWP